MCDLSATFIAAQAGKLACMLPGERLQKLMEFHDLGLEDVASRVRAAGAPSVKYQHIQQLLATPTRRPRYLPELAKAFGMTVEEFLDGSPALHGRYRIADRTEPTGVVREDVPARPYLSSSTELSTTRSAGEIPSGYVRFPLLDGFVAAGDGGYVADYPEVVREIDVAEDWVRRNITAPAERVRVITAQGDSMQPDIGSGDVLFVDSGIRWFDSDAVYVMNWRGRPIVKRLQLRRDGRLLIKSANPAYEPEEVPPGEVDQLHISGRVVGVWHFKKY